jgi:hypothetical protein
MVSRSQAFCDSCVFDSRRYCKIDDGDIKAAIAYGADAVGRAHARPLKSRA